MNRFLIFLIITLYADILFAAPDYESSVRPLLKKYCLDCHHAGDQPEADLNLERFQSHTQVLHDRSIWSKVYEKVESHQMPPPKEDAVPSLDERKLILNYIDYLAALPDPSLNAPDPGKPIIRRLTRLEYNNSVRDLLKLDRDVFMFPERLPFVGKTYFEPATGKLLGPFTIATREYGGKYPVLLPSSGLPGDSRAENGFRNRGEVMNLSPVLLDNYVSSAGAIAQHPDLIERSHVFVELLGLNPIEIVRKYKPDIAAPKNIEPPTTVAAVSSFSPNIKELQQPLTNSLKLPEFLKLLNEAHQDGRGGVFDISPALKNNTISGKGGLIKVAYADNRRELTINPNLDLWLVGFSSAQPASTPLLIANKAKGEKSYELSFKFTDEPDVGITHLGLCVLTRKDQQGTVTLTATYSDGLEQAVVTELSNDKQAAGFISFKATPGEHLHKIKVDGSKLNGDYILLDNLAFITNDSPLTKLINKPIESAEVNKKTPDDVPSVAPPTEKPAIKQPLETRVKNFLHIAFRRSVTDTEYQHYLNTISLSRQQGMTEEQSLRLFVQTVLSSPHFIFVTEDVTNKPLNEKQTATVRALNDDELAERLSLFLWASTPDAELLKLAAQGELHKEAVLRAQVARMLKHSQIRELSESFAMQWLRLDQLYTSKPDQELYPRYYSGPQGKETLHASQLLEALLLFETVLLENRTILDFIAADYTWVNPKLEKLYQLGKYAEVTELASNDNSSSTREVREKENSPNNLWQRVSTKGTPRGGYLTMSAPLTITSLPFRTSPVKRGAWILETIFNRPPTEPKVAFAIANDTKESTVGMSIREKFEAHRNQPACYSCHIRLDPPGFAMEQFDAIGNLRTNSRENPVDANSTWNNRDFNGASEFKAIILGEHQEFSRGFIEHLLSYALCRKLEIYDMPTINSIIEKTKHNNHRLQDIIQEIVCSYPFTHTRN